MHQNTDYSILQKVLVHELKEMQQEQGKDFDIRKVNLAELSRRTGLSRSKLRYLKEKNFVNISHGRTGKKYVSTVLAGYTTYLDSLLCKGFTNSSYCFEKLRSMGYTGSLTTIKNYISAHQSLTSPEHFHPSKKYVHTGYCQMPGKIYEMDWGYLNIKTNLGDTHKVACFVMMCHYCGQRYIEFFQNTQQENLILGMSHAFCYMGVPQYVIAERKKSFVIQNQSKNPPLWQDNYKTFMEAIGFCTKLCSKHRYPFAQNEAERLIDFVKDNFIKERIFLSLLDLNLEAIGWCNQQNNCYQKEVSCSPSEIHQDMCMSNAFIPLQTQELAYYIYPERRISSNGFINYEGKRFQVPHWYDGKTCRIRKDFSSIHIYSSDLSQLLSTYQLTE